MIRVERRNVHLHQADKWAAEIRPVTAAAIDDHSDGRDDAAVLPNDVDRLLYAATPGDHVFGHDEPLVRRDCKTASQDQPAGFLLRKDVPFPERAAHLLPDHNSAQRRGDDSVTFDRAQLVSQPATNIRRDAGVLQQQRALEELPAMEPRTQNEVSIKQRARLAEEREQIVAHARLLFADIDTQLPAGRRLIGDGDAFNLDTRGFRKSRHLDR